MKEVRRWPDLLELKLPVKPDCFSLMGLEASCTLRRKGESFAGTAHLDSNQLTFRGGSRLTLRLAEIRSVSVAAGGKLVLAHPDGPVVLEFGARSVAQNWERKIRYPKDLIDKLGVKPDSRVAVLGETDPDFARKLRERLTTPVVSALFSGLDLIFYAADSAAELARLKALKKHVQPAGAIWVVSRKGKLATIRDTDVMRAARAAGLVDVKVCGFSATHTALKLVIPKADR